MPVFGTRYTYQQAPWDAPLSLGVQAFIEYNGLIINDRYQSDRIRVTSITGLDGPDITDVREVVPGDEGEFAYPSLARGRTFVVSGKIQAGSLATCTQMATDLRTAYAPLAEAPMKFRWFDVYDSFDDSQTWKNYTVIYNNSGTQFYSLPVTGGVMRWAATNEILVTRSAENRLWGDVQVSLRLIAGGYEDLSKFAVVLALIDQNNYLAVMVDDTTLKINAVVGGTTYTLASQTTSSSLTQGRSFWLRGRREGNLVTGEIWLSKPQETAYPDFECHAYLAGSDADSYGEAVLSEVGILGNAMNTYWAIDDFTVESLYPGDISFPVRTITKPSIQDAQQIQTIFERAFQLTLRASWPYAKSATQRRSPLLYPSSGGTTQLGFANPLTNPLSATNILPGSVSLENNLLFVRNRGKAPIRPLLVVYGSVENFAIYNLTNDMQLTWQSSLGDGDYLVIDCQRRTIVDQTGANQKAPLSYSDSRWMLLEPDWNDLYFVGSGYDSNTRVGAFLNDGWI